MERRTILFVDDDPQIRELVSSFFEDEDTTELITAGTGAEGVAILESQAPIDLLVTDIVMPGEIDGFELAHRAKQLRPNLRVIYVSGFIKQIPWGQKGVGYGPLMSKPFRLEDLGSAMRQAMDPSA